MNKNERENKNLRLQQMLHQRFPRYRITSICQGSQIRIKINSGMTFYFAPQTCKIRKTGDGFSQPGGGWHHGNIQKLIKEIERYSQSNSAIAESE
jgi:hypothetical protein